jgi:hypothetical protein
MSEIWVYNFTRCNEDNIRIGAHGIMETKEIMPHGTTPN